MATKYDYKNLGRKQSKSGKIRKNAKFRRSKNYR